MMTMMIDVDKTDDRSYENDESNLESDDDHGDGNVAKNVDGGDDMMTMLMIFF